MALALGFTASAAHAQTLISNIEQGDDGTAGTALSQFDQAQGFTTGPNAGGYTLTSVDLLLDRVGGTITVRVATGLPSATTEVATLVSPSSIVTGTNTFTAPSGTTLSANTTYFVVIEGTLDRVRYTLSTSEDPGGASGWSIADVPLERVKSPLGPWRSGTRPSGGLVLIGVNGSARASTPPPGGTTKGLRGPPQPLQLALWTDRLGYRAGETVRLYRSVDPHDDLSSYRTFVYLERAGGAERRYLAPLSADGRLHAEAVDHRGLPAASSSARSLSAADKELIWEGTAPDPGLWHFVMELRPGTAREQAGKPDEPTGTRRAWAKFSVAERSVLFNRRGFDREIRDDLTLRSDTIHYLGHQLFVHDGATLTIEPGTVVQAWGQNAGIIVEPGGRIVAEGTREAPVVLTCSLPVGWRQPGCWSGLRILGRAPVTRLEGVAPGVLPAERPVYGGSDAESSSGALRYVRVEFAGAAADPEAAVPAIGLYGVGSGTVLDHVQAHASLGDGFAFAGGTAVCEHCVASGSGAAGLAWERGWRGGASHLYVQQGRGGSHGLVGGHDEEGYDREPRSLPSLSNVTLVHAVPYGRRARRAIALQLSDGSGVQVRDLLVTSFGGGAIRASGRSRLLFSEGESSVSGALLYLNGYPQLRGQIADAVQVDDRNPRLRDVRDYANPDPRPKPSSPALPDDREGYIGAFGREENWLEEWTVFGPESVYDLRQRAEDGN